jgi:hypothetical protein
MQNSQNPDAQTQQEFQSQQQQIEQQRRHIQRMKGQQETE